MWRTNRYFTIRTSRLPMDRSCGAEGDRTPDLVNAIHALSQLSYSPACIGSVPVPPFGRDPRPATIASLAAGSLALGGTGLSYSPVGGFGHII